MDLVLGEEKVMEWIKKYPPFINALDKPLEEQLIVAIQAGLPITEVQQVLTEKMMIAAVVCNPFSIGHLESSSKVVKRITVNGLHKRIFGDFSTDPVSLEKVRQMLIMAAQAITN